MNINLFTMRHFRSLWKKCRSEKTTNQFFHFQSCRSNGSSSSLRIVAERPRMPLGCKWIYFGGKLVENILLMLF